MFNPIKTIYLPNSILHLVDHSAPHLAPIHLEQCFYKPKEREYYFLKEPSNLLTMQNFFIMIQAAGILLHDQDEYLFIHRLGYWDLPKGKVEQGEELDLAARRELKEETNLGVLGKIEPLLATAHCYLQEDKPIYKTTYWFLAQGNRQDPIRVQVEENIDDVQWITKEQIPQKILPYTYPTIRQVLAQINIV